MEHYQNGSGQMDRRIHAMTDTPDACVGLIADSHGNLDATAEAIRLLKERGADVIVHLGDFLDSVRRTRAAAMISLLRENRVVTVKGNNDFLVEHMLTDERRHPDPAGDRAATFLRSVPITRAFNGLLFAHSLPFDSLRSFYEPIDTGNTQRATRLFAETEFELLFCGHSHLPIIFRKAGSLVTREEVPAGVKVILHTPGAAPGRCGESTMKGDNTIDRDRFIIVVGAADDGECALYDRSEWVYERVKIG
jgi:predicted phosphodiesterase